MSEFRKRMDIAAVAANWHLDGTVDADPGFKAGFNAGFAEAVRMLREFSNGQIALPGRR